MTCQSTIDLISSHVDDEATDAESGAVEAHVAACAACAALLESHRALKHGLAALEARVSPSQAVRARVEAQRFRNRSRRRRLQWLAVAAGAAAAVAVIVAGVAQRSEDTAGPAREPRTALAEELIADHLKYAPQVMPAEVASADPETVRRFFVGAVGFVPAVPDLPSARLLGGRLCSIDGRKVQLLFYEQAGRRLSLYVSDGPALAGECRGDGPYNVCSRNHEGLTLTLVGAVPVAEIRALLESAELDVDNS
jgi:anti-sigma factor RsiW